MSKSLDTVKVAATLQAISNSSEATYPYPTEITFQLWGMTYQNLNGTSVDVWTALYEPVIMQPDVEEMIPFTHFFHIDPADAGKLQI
mgnify:FL=1